MTWGEVTLVLGFVAVYWALFAVMVAFTLWGIGLVCARVYEKYGTGMEKERKRSAPSAERGERLVHRGRSDGRHRRRRRSTVARSLPPKVVDFFRF